MISNRENRAESRMERASGTFDPSYAPPPAPALGSALTVNGSFLAQQVTKREYRIMRRPITPALAPVLLATTALAQTACPAGWTRKPCR